jgi:hypothetical protein
MRFSAEVEQALTRARRAAREAAASAADFRRRTEELAGQAKSARLPDREPAPRPPNENEDFSHRQVLFDIDGEMPGQTRDEPAETSAPERKATRASDTEEDFSQQRILLDATVETYRPDGMPGVAGEWADDENRR